MLGRLTSRTRFTVAVAVAALPLLALIAYSAVDRYRDDRARAETRAVTRASLYAALLAEAGVVDRAPQHGELQHMLELMPLPPGDAVVVFDGSREVARSGAGAAGPAGPVPATGDFRATGADGVERVWGVAPIADGPLRIAFGMPGTRSTARPSRHCSGTCCWPRWRCCSSRPPPTSPAAG